MSPAEQQSMSAHTRHSVHTAVLLLLLLSPAPPPPLLLLLGPALHRSLSDP